MGQTANFGMTLGTSAFNFILQEISNAIAHKRNVKTAKEFMALENQYLRSNMDYQNQMNINNFNQFESPAAQRRLLTEAGYNPMLAQNNFSGNIGTASASAPHQSAPQVNPTQVLPIDLAADYMSLKSMKLGLERQKLENEELRVNIDNIRTDTNYKNNEIDINNSMLPYNQAYLMSQTEINKLEGQLRELQIKSVDSALQKQIYNDTLDIFKISQEMDYYYKNPQLYQTILDTQTNLLIKQLEQQDLQNKLTQAQISKINADIQTVLLQNKVLKSDVDAYTEWFEGLTPEEKEQVTKAKNNIMSHEGSYYSSQQVEVMIHKAYQEVDEEEKDRRYNLDKTEKDRRYEMDKEEKDRRFVMDAALGTVNAACNVANSISNFLPTNIVKNFVSTNSKGSTKTSTTTTSKRKG